jgi:hypothetical protein
MRAGALLLLAGCQRLFQLQPVPASDANGPVDVAADSDSLPPLDVAGADGTRGIGPALVQQTTNETNGTGLDVALPASPANGNVLVLVGGAECGLTGVSGGGVASWQQAAYSGDSPTDAIYFGVTDGSPASVHLTPQCSAKTWGLLTEWRGLATMNTLDDHNNFGMAGTNNSGTLDIAVDPTAAPDLLVFGIACYGATGDAASPWVELDEVTASATITQRAWYQLAPSPGQYHAVVTYSNEYDSTIVAFRAASAQ